MMRTYDLFPFVSVICSVVVVCVVNCPHLIMEWLSLLSFDSSVLWLGGRKGIRPVKN